MAANQKVADFVKNRFGRRLFTNAAFFLFFATVAIADVKPGDVFPSLSAANLTGSIPPTAGQVVLIDFWASWCQPCRASFPIYARLHEAYSSRGLVIVGIGVDQDPAAFAAFVRKFNPPFAIVHDSAQKLVSRVNVPTLPTSYLMGRNGRVRFVHAGFFGGRTEHELTGEIETLLAERPPSR